MSSKPSIVDVALAAGVSKSTVSRVLSGDPAVSTTTAEKVREACRALKYRPNTSARELRSAAPGRVGMLVPERISGSFMYPLNSEKLQGAVSRAAELDQDMVVFVYNPGSRRDLHQLILEKGLSGVLLFDNVGADVLTHLAQYDIPFVQVNWFVNGYPHQLYVKTDLAEAVRLGFDHLYRQGYRDIGLIHWEDLHLQEAVVSSAFQACLESRGLASDPGRLVPFNTDAVASLLSPRRRAYLCFAYGTSQHLYAYCRQSGLRIPEDLALVSYDFFEFYDFVHPRLTGIKQPSRTIGRAAVDMLLARMAGEPVSSLLLPPELLVRDSA